MKHIKVLSSIAILVFLLLLFANGIVAATKPVWGWAWASNIGWISFNSINCDPNGNGTYEGAPTGCPTSGTAYPYKVEIDVTSGILSGYAWSSSIGWISFNSNTNPQYPIDSLVGCPSGTCQASTDFTKNPKELNGWARACSVFSLGCSGGLKSNTGGWDGWIKLDGTISSGGSYKVWADVLPSPSPAQLHSYAWGGNETNGDWLKKAVVGWISFNCAEAVLDDPATGVCPPPGLPQPPGTSNYKVLTSFNFNRAPSANSLGVSFGDFCCDWGNDPPAILSGTFTDQDVGDYLTGYQIQIDDDTNFDSDPLDTTTPPRGCPDPLSGFVPAGPAPNFACSANGLKYNTSSYYWRAKVWDSKGDESQWIYPPSSTTPPGISFSTPLHKYPCPNFSIIPSGPSAGEEVNFIDSSECWEPSYQCNTNLNNRYVWNFGDEVICDSGIGIVSDCRALIVTHTYEAANPTGYDVTLTVTDDIGTCSETKNLKVQLPLPEWKEIPPTSMISKFLANVSSFLKNFLNRT